MLSLGNCNYIEDRWFQTDFRTVTEFYLKLIVTVSRRLISLFFCGGGCNRLDVHQFHRSSLFFLRFVISWLVINNFHPFSKSYIQFINFKGNKYNCSRIWISHLDQHAFKKVISQSSFSFDWEITNNRDSVLPYFQISLSSSNYAPFRLLSFTLCSEQGGTVAGSSFGKYWTGHKAI